MCILFIWNECAEGPKDSYGEFLRDKSQSERSCSTGIPFGTDGRYRKGLKTPVGQGINDYKIMRSEMIIY